MNKEKNKIIPELRFSEFMNDGEWKETSLNKISPSIFDGTHQTPKYTKEGIPFFSVENIVSGSDNKFISREDYLYETRNNKPGYGDVLITRIGSIGIPKVVDWKYEFSVYVTLAVIKKSSNFDSNYLGFYIQSNRFQQEIKRRSLLKAAPQKINMNELRLCEVLLPPKVKEQQKIANCLSSLDEVINAETKKLDLLIEHKKGLLQQLFPQEGEVQPKYRFPEFKNEGDWKQTILDAIADYANGKAHEKEISKTGKYKVVNSKFISTEGEVVKYSDSVNLETKIGDILMVLSDIPNGKALAKCFYVDKDDTYTVNQRICKITTRGVNSVFLFYQLNRNKYFLRFDDGAKQTNLRKDAVLNCPILKPTNPKEQDKIANTLVSANDLIIEQRRKIDSLQNHKKGLLQQLFPNINEVAV